MTAEDQYVPDEMDARGCFLDGAAGAFVREDWEAFLARVRRDAWQAGHTTGFEDALLACEIASGVKPGPPPGPTPNPHEEATP